MGSTPYVGLLDEGRRVGWVDGIVDGSVVGRDRGRLVGRPEGCLEGAKQKRMSGTCDDG